MLLLLFGEEVEDTAEEEGISDGILEMEGFLLLRLLFGSGCWAEM
jgi:hypothetical protein